MIRNRVTMFTLSIQPDFGQDAIDPHGLALVVGLSGSRLVCAKPLIAAGVDPRRPGEYVGRFKFAARTPDVPHGRYLGLWVEYTPKPHGLGAYLTAGDGDLYLSPVDVDLVGLTPPAATGLGDRTELAQPPVPVGNGWQVRVYLTMRLRRMARRTGPSGVTDVR